MMTSPNFPEDPYASTQHDRADELENDRDLVGDAASAVRDFASEEQGYHKTLKPRTVPTPR
jgi:L-asparagine permease